MTSPASLLHRRPTGADVAAALRWVASGDVALVYAGIVTVVALWLSLLSPALHQRAVLQVSTNLANLHHRPLAVLVESAFVVESLRALAELPLLIIVFTLCQRWVGRVATVVVGVLGHVGATLFVATLLASGITRGRLSASVAHASDVGVSYGVACVAAFVTDRVPRRWRPWYVVALVAWFAVPLARNPGFTALGHATALVLGFALATIARQAARRAAA